MQMKDSMSLIVDAAALVFGILLLREVSATSRPLHGITGKRMNVHSEAAVAVEGLVLLESLANGQPDRNLPKPPPPPKSSMAGSPFEAGSLANAQPGKNLPKPPPPLQSSMAGSPFEAGLPEKSCRPHHDKTVACPPSLRTEKNEMDVNAKEEITRNHQHIPPVRNQFLQLRIIKGSKPPIFSN